MMRHLLFGLCAAGLMVSAWAQDQTYADCLVKTGSSWGQPCEKCENYKGYERDYSGVYQIHLKNVCSEMLDVKIAMGELNGNWRTFPVRTIQGGDTLTAFACQGSGKYLYWVRKVNDTEIILPSDAEINSTYRGQ